MPSFHCPACEGSQACPGAVIPDPPRNDDEDAVVTGFSLHFHTQARVPWRQWWRALLGRPVKICIDIDEPPGHFIDITDLTTDGLLGPDDLTGPDGPWKDLS